MLKFHILLVILAVVPSGLDGKCKYIFYRIFVIHKRFSAALVQEITCCVTLLA